MKKEKKIRTNVRRNTQKIVMEGKMKMKKEVSMKHEEKKWERDTRNEKRITEGMRGNANRGEYTTTKGKEEIKETQARCKVTENKSCESERKLNERKRCAENGIFYVTWKLPGKP